MVLSSVIVALAWDYPAGSRSTTGYHGYIALKPPAVIAAAGSALRDAATNDSANSNARMVVLIKSSSEDLKVEIGGRTAMGRIASQARKARKLDRTAYVSGLGLVQ